MSGFLLGVGGSGVFASIANSSVLGPGDVVNFYGAVSTISMQVSATGNPTRVKVVLEVSLDGVNFYTPAALIDTGDGDFLTDIKVASSIPCAFARANLIALSGGIAPTVSVNILGVS